MKKAKKKAKQTAKETKTGTADGKEPEGGERGREVMNHMMIQENLALVPTDLVHAIAVV